MSEKMLYISKEDCQKRGYVKRNGMYYRLTVLERYLERGWLDFGNRDYSDQDRFAAGEELLEDFQKCRFAGAKSSNFGRERVDGTPLPQSELESVCRARDRYFAKVRQIPAEFWPMVRLVCLENEEPDIAENVPARRRAEMLFAAKQDLCRGLDRLIEYKIKCK